MNFPNYFADAESSFDDADFILFGVPYDKTSSFRPGAAKAPNKIREASWNFETFDFRTGIDLQDINIHDYGNLDVESDSTEKMLQKVNEFASKIVSSGKIPIAIGGEHSITPGIVKAFTKDVAVVSLDAHMDFRKEYEHDKNNHACVIRRISDHINIENIAVLGIRSADKEEFYDAKKQNLFYIDSFAIKEKGIKKAVDETKKHICDKSIYFTLDIDVIDPSFVPGTSTPEPFGISSFDVLECLRFFSPNIIGFDIVEVCPAYDNGESSLLAAKIIRIAIQSIWANKFR